MLMKVFPHGTGAGDKTGRYLKFQAPEKIVIRQEG